MHLGDRLRALRTALGLTQEKLADRAGLRRTEINRLEKGTNQGTSHAIRKALARGFEMTEAHLDEYLDGPMPVKDARGHCGETKHTVVTTTPAELESELGPVERAIARMGPLLWPEGVEELRARAANETRTELGWLQAAVEVQRGLESRRPPPKPKEPPRPVVRKPRRAS